MAKEVLPGRKLAQAARLPRSPGGPWYFLHRIHRSEHEAIHFATGRGHRFNDPESHFGVCYLAFDRAGAFVETLLRDSADNVVEQSAIDARSVAAVELNRDLQLVPLYGRYLSMIGANATATHGRYGVSQAWSRALYRHGDAPDGIAYPASHDNSLTAVALFDRARDAVASVRSVALRHEIRFLDEMADHYKFITT